MISISKYFITQGHLHFPKACICGKEKRLIFATQNVYIERLTD